MLITKKLNSEPDYNAPDGSRIHLLPETSKGGLSFCELPVGDVSSPVCHRSVEEIWYFMSGEGEIWRKTEEEEEVTMVKKEISITIPLGCHFQFRNTGEEPLRFLIVTLPKWPGPDEAFSVQGHWNT